jgi:N-acetylmuramoyl-L-alanine amidase
MSLTFIDRPSPNWNERLRPVSIVVLHYTGMGGLKAALGILTDPQPIAGAYPGPWHSDQVDPAAAMNRVSSHYLVDENGDLYRLVAEDKRAWHAGAGSWQGREDLNSASIGIEIVNGGHDFGLPDYPEAQIAAVIALVKDILARWSLPVTAVIGHSDLAPGRKPDPGEKFPWARLAAEGCSFWPGEPNGDRRALFDQPDMIDSGIALVQTGLGNIGYGIEVNGRLDKPTRDVITAFQRRFRPAKVDGLVDLETMDLIARVVKMLKAPA